MKRYIICLLTVALMCINLNSTVYAEGISKEELLNRLNKDMKNIYDYKVDYYTESCDEGDINFYYKNQIRGGESIYSYIPAYGGQFGNTDEIANENEFLGRMPSGQAVPNPQFGWNIGWDAVRISKWGVAEPWQYNSSRRTNYINKIINSDKYGIDTLEQAIQLGVDMVYGGKRYSQIKAKDCNISVNGNPIVHEGGKKPECNWINYVHIVIPPTETTWGQGRIYKENGNYMGIPIAAFELIGPNLTVTLECAQAEGAGVRNDDVVKASAIVKSTFDENVDTTYKWTVKGNTTGTMYQQKEESACKFTGYGEGASQGSTTIPSEGSEFDAVFDLEFIMPREPVTITFEINPSKNPEESIYTDNKDSESISWIRYDIAKANYTLYYDELTKELEHELAGGGIPGSVQSPNKSLWSWDGNLTGALNVDIEDNDGALSDAKVKDDTNPPVDEAAESVTRSPIIQGVIKREEYGDFYLPNLSNPIREMIVFYEGDVKRDYDYHTSHSVYCCENEDGSSHYYDCSGCSTYYGSGTQNGIFQPGEDRISITTQVYNGRKPMPSVEARHFKKEIDDNTHDSLNKTIWWESDEYEMFVQRWMKNVFATGDMTYEAIQGQHERIFTQQNKAMIEWGINQSMSSIYEEDLNSAKRKSTNKLDYPHVPFATDRDLQRQYKYPFKSGYYFNPAGEYTLTIRTEIYKDEAKETQEHKDLVDKVLQSFNYGSNMTYIDKGSQYQLKLEIDDPTASIAAEGLLGIQRDYTYVTEYEVPYSPDAAGFTHTYFKEILEGYEESNTQNSKDEYKYREYIQEGQYICKVVEETLVTITVNPDNQKCYTFGGMKNGKYYMTAWLK
ncbi:hypothetical protein [Cellulosilyticum lentocellum]|uniref:Uncharacterized protein n=1 Tax=Cellulosilyticum lentocellum (strain ATCC 49066 / DSM 5427 / NCIMB 11756 / RHM5) TaxID=642492 RepID=F2JHS0_CELLD|nr:hypothetical protein [Cellulosilyticum lentocellum]ADZ85412.1 hypothetical protein Clole_3731 [Cellulosilyticum lentocellum DSM 5427]